jgi:hypothetical protein
MKKLLIVGSTLILLAACSSAQASKKERFTSGYDNRLNISTDTKTGCKYLIFDWSHQGGITPLLKSDGTPDCGK